MTPFILTHYWVKQLVLSLSHNWRNKLRDVKSLSEKAAEVVPKQGLTPRLSLTSNLMLLLLPLNRERGAQFKQKKSWFCKVLGSSAYTPRHCHPAKCNKRALSTPQMFSCLIFFFFNFSPWPHFLRRANKQAVKGRGKKKKGEAS